MHCALAVFTSMVLVLLLALATCAQPIGDWPESGSKRQVTGVIPDLCHPPFKMIRKRCRLVSRKRAAGRLQQLLNDTLCYKLERKTPKCCFRNRKKCKKPCPRGRLIQGRLSCVVTTRNSILFSYKMRFPPAVLLSTVLVLILAWTTFAQPIGDWPEESSYRRQVGDMPEQCHPPYKMIRERCRLLMDKRSLEGAQHLLRRYVSPRIHVVAAAAAAGAGGDGAAPGGERERRPAPPGPNPRPGRAHHHHYHHRRTRPGGHHPPAGQPTEELPAQPQVEARTLPPGGSGTVSESVGSLRQNRDNAMFGDEVDY
ncbi:Protein of unknown function [Gryllus bimaculatus]|nr:Protein of unknown function [Gryllus bimaculatus]